MTNSFQLVGGHVALDFANTLDNRFHPAGSAELLNSYLDLLRFCQEAALKASDARSLARIVHFAEADIALRSAKELREAIQGIFSAVAERRRAGRGDVAILNEHVGQALAHRKIGESHGSFEWSWRGLAERSTGPIWPIAYAAAELLVSPDIEFVRQCNEPTCRWLFLDHSKNHSRRWCDMQVCGNRTKARRYYRNQVDAVSPA